jgi:hypothetical protein
MSSSRVRAIHLAQMGAWQTDPDADGSDYLPLNFDGMPDPVDGTESEEVAAASGRNEPGEIIITRSGGKLDLAIPFRGYAAGSGDGDAAPTADVIDYVFANAFGTAIQATGGEGVGSGSTTSNIVLDAAITDLGSGSLLPVLMADTPTRTQWRRVGTIATATYPVTPDWPIAPVTAGVAYGVRGYGQANQLQTQTVGLATIANVAGTLHRLIGGRIGKLGLDCIAGKKTVLNASLMYDSYEEGATAASLPNVTSYPSPIIQTLAPFYWNGTLYPIRSLKIDFGLKTVEVPATQGINGRGSFDVVEIDPVVTVELAWAPTTWNTAFQAGTVGELLAHVGGTFGAAGRPNSAAFHALRAQIQVAPPNADQGGVLTQTVTFKVLGSGGNALRRWGMYRC